MTKGYRFRSHTIETFRPKEDSYVILDDNTHAERPAKDQKAEQLLSSLGEVCLAQDLISSSKGDPEARARYELNALLNKEVTGDDYSLWTCRQNGCTFAVAVGDGIESEAVLGEASCEPGQRLAARLRSS